MSGRIENLSEELRELADSAAPESRVDPALAMRRGKGRLLRRRLSVLGGAAVIAAGATVLAMVLPPGHRSDGVAPAVSSTPSPSATAAGSTPLPALGPDTGHDPLTVEAGFGWLPDNFVGVSYMKGSSPNTARANGKPLSETNVPMIWLKLYGPGQEPTVGTFPTGAQQYKVEAPPVNGRSAYWLGTGPTDWAALGSDRYLRWQAADGRWVEIMSTYMAQPDLQEVLHRVAENVVVGHRAVSLPFRLSQVPKGLELSQVEAHNGGLMSRYQPWTVQVIYRVSGTDNYISTTMDPGRPEPSPSLLPGMTLPTEHRIPHTCVTANGVRACTSSVQGDKAYESVGGPQAWLGRFTLLGDDLRKWTTEVTGG